MSFAMPLGLLCSGALAEQIGVEKWFYSVELELLLLLFWFLHYRFYETLTANLIKSNHVKILTK